MLCLYFLREYYRLFLTNLLSRTRSGIQTNKFKPRKGLFLFMFFVWPKNQSQALFESAKRAAKTDRHSSKHDCICNQLWPRRRVQASPPYKQGGRGRLRLDSAKTEAAASVSEGPALRPWMLCFFIVFRQGILLNMKVLIFYRPASEHARAVDEFVHEFQRRYSDHELTLIDIDSVAGSQQAEIYDIVQYPCVIATTDSGASLQRWDSGLMPLLNEVAYFANS